MMVYLKLKKYEKNFKLFSAYYRFQKKIWVHKINIFFGIYFFNFDIFYFCLCASFYTFYIHSNLI